ncbi:DMT family transporter [candidate division KSB1 bacterium]|nr:DMT family transporter [candidate division KSB1 bacterium]
MRESERARAALLPAVMAVSSAAIFVRMADAPAMATAFWRGAIAGACFLPLLLLPKFRAELRNLPGKTAGQIAAATMVIALHQICFISSLKFTSVAAATFLTSMQPMFTAFFGWVLLKEAVSARALLAICGALGGVALIALSSGGEFAMTGNLLAIAAAILASLYSIAARKLRQNTPLVPYMTTVHISGTLFLFVLTQLFAIPLTGFSNASWTSLALLGLVPTLIGHSLLTYSIGHLRAFVVNAAVLGEPVGATILAAIFMREIPPLLTLLGGAVIVGCILWIVLEKDVPVVETQMD